MSHLPTANAARRSIGWPLRRPARWLTVCSVLLLIAAGVIYGLSDWNQMAVVSFIRSHGGGVGYASNTKVVEHEISFSISTGASVPKLELGTEDGEHGLSFLSLLSSFSEEMDGTYSARMAICCESDSPSLFRRALGDRCADVWDRVIAIGLTDCAVPRAVSGRLTDIRTVRWLDLSRCQIDHGDLSAFLQVSPELEWLILDQASIDDRTLQSLENCRRLRWLDVARTNVTDRGLQYLERLDALRVLKVSDTAITNAGLEHIGRLVGLTELHLNGTRIDDQGVASLSRLTDLERLSLHGIGITDAALRQLASFPNLKYLDVSSTSISDAAIEEFQRKRPSLTLSYAWRER
jgi:Leucine-rich repeat (LRR) protein